MKKPAFGSKILAKGWFFMLLTPMKPGVDL